MNLNKDKQGKPSIISLILSIFRSIISFFNKSRKYKKEVEKENDELFLDVKHELKNKYKEIDDNADKEKQKSTKDRINNMF